MGLIYIGSDLPMYIVNYLYFSHFIHPKTRTIKKHTHTNTQTMIFLLIIYHFISCFKKKKKKKKTRLIEGTKLVIGGVTIPHTLGAGNICTWLPLIYFNNFPQIVICI